MPANLKKDFLSLCMEYKAMRFGDFTLKSGRQSPYFFNTGLFNDGAAMQQLCAFYAKTILASGLAFDTLFGPAYKGIPLVTGTAMELAKHGHNYPFCFNRKEAKDHGEGGNTAGAPIRGRVLIVEDVISAGTAVRESAGIIQKAGATLAGVIVAFDRQERGTDDIPSTKSAIQEIEAAFNIPVMAIAKLEDLAAFLASSPDMQEHSEKITAYRKRYGADLKS